MVCMCHVVCQPEDHIPLKITGKLSVNRKSSVNKQLYSMRYSSIVLTLRATRNASAEAEVIFPEF